MKEGINKIAPMVLSLATLVIASAPANAQKGSGPAGVGVSSALGVGPAGPVGNASFVGVGPNNIMEGVGPAGPIGNAGFVQSGTQIFTNGNQGISIDGRTRTDYNGLNGGSGYGFSTQGYGFGLGIGAIPYVAPTGGVAPLSPEEERRKREMMLGRNVNSNAPSSMSIARRGGDVVAVRETMVNGKMVRTEGTIIREYGTVRPRGERLANRSTVKTRTFARTYLK